MKEVKELLEQEWAVTEDGKKLLEGIYEQMKVMREMIDALDQRLRHLDEQMTLQQEIADLKERITEVEEQRTTRIDPGYTPLPSPPCTPGRSGSFPSTSGVWTTGETYTNTGSFADGLVSWYDAPRSYTEIGEGGNPTVTTALVGADPGEVYRLKVTDHVGNYSETFIIDGGKDITGSAGSTARFDAKTGQVTVNFASGAVTTHSVYG